MKILFAEPDVKYPNKIRRDGRRAEIGIRLNYALLAGYIRDNYPDAEATIKPYRLLDHLGQTYDLEADIQDADIVCVGASTAEYNSARRITQQARSQGKITVMGGLYPTSNADSVLSNGAADYVVRGEGEKTLLELVKALEQDSPVDNIAGISFRRENSIIHNKERTQIHDIDEIKPAYDLLPMQDYAAVVKGLVYTSRGCDNDCSFCTVSPHWNYRQRSRSIDSVIEELKLYRDIGFNEVNFKDESLVTDRARLMEILQRIKSEGLGMRFKAKARIKELDDEVLAAMRDAGFEEIHTGIESITTSFRKGLDTNELLRRLYSCLDHGFVLNPSFILGLPGQTPDGLLRDADFIMSIGRHERVKVYTCMYTPHPGSKARDDNRMTIVSDDLDDYTHLRLVAVPKSLGETQEAILLLHKVQKMVVEAVGGSEAELIIP